MTLGISGHDMGAPEEAGKAVGSVVKALESQPVVLAVLIFNLLYIGITAWQTIDARRQFRELIGDLLRNCAGLKPAPSSVVFKPDQDRLIFSLDPTLRDQPSKPR